MVHDSLISLNKVSFKYQDRHEHWILQDFDFEFKNSDRVAIYGPNGCGKSTLLYLLAGLLERQKGRRVETPGLQIGFVFQDYNRSVFNWYSVAENLKLGRPPLGQGHEKEDSFLDAFGVSPPGWLVNVYHRYPYELSGGQRQFISFCRSVLGRPQALLMDEPFASLDMGHKQLAIDLMQRARPWLKGWIVTAHDLDDCLLTAEKVVVMRGPPVRVAQIVEVSREWPRGYQFLASGAAQSARKEVYNALWSGCFTN